VREAELLDMSDKPIAGLVTAVAIAPLLVVCCLGPAVVASALAGIAAWFSGANAVTVTGLAILAAMLAYGSVRWRKARRA
jgi:hypothetical protein